MRPLPLLTGAVVGLLSSLPAALLAFFVFGSDFQVAAPIAGAAVGSGVLTGATFGRLVAVSPTLPRLLLAPVASSMLGAALHVLIAHLMYGVSGDVLGTILLHLITNTIPGYIAMALPCFLLGVAVVRVIARILPNEAGAASAG